MPGARRPEDLFVWRVCAELRDEIQRLVREGPASRDPDFRYQIGKSSRSAPNNISEGFGLYRPRLFARHVRIALGSLHETGNLLREAAESKYFSPQDTGRLLWKTAIAEKAARRLLRYLESLRGRAPSDWNYDLPNDNSSA